MSDRIEFPASVAHFHLELVPVEPAHNPNGPRPVASIGVPHDVAQRLVQRRDHSARLGGTEIEFTTATFDHGPRQPQPARVADYSDVNPCDHDLTGNWCRVRQAATRRDCNMPRNGAGPGTPAWPGRRCHPLENGLPTPIGASKSGPRWNDQQVSVPCSGAPASGSGRTGRRATREPDHPGSVPALPGFVAVSPRQPRRCRPFASGPRQASGLARAGRNRPVLD